MSDVIGNPDAPVPTPADTDPDTKSDPTAPDVMPASDDDQVAEAMAQFAERMSAAVAAVPHDADETASAPGLGRAVASLLRRAADHLRNPEPSPASDPNTPLPGESAVAYLARTQGK